MLSLISKIQKGIADFRENRKHEKIRICKWKNAKKASGSKDYQRACQLLEEFSKDYPEACNAYFNWGVMLVHWAELDNKQGEEKLRLACDKFRKTTEVNKDHYEAFFNWAFTLLKLGDLNNPEAEKHFQEACGKLKEAVDIKRERYEPFMLWGFALYKLANLRGPKAEEYYQQAFAKFQKAEEIRPDKPEVYNNWGVAFSSWAKLNNSQAEVRYNLACEKYEIAVKLNPKCIEALSNWSASLIYRARLAEPAMADELFREACAKCQKAIKFRPDFPTAYVNLGYAHIAWSKLKTAEEKKQLLHEAEKFLLKAEEIKKGTGAYNLACLYIFWGDEDKCKYWFKVGEEAKTLETREHAMKDEDFALVRDKDWFKAIRWKGE